MLPRHMFTNICDYECLMNRYGLTYDSKAVPEVSRMGSMEGAIVHAWRAQGWFVNMFEVKPIIRLLCKPVACKTICYQVVDIKVIYLK